MPTSGVPSGAVAGACLPTRITVPCQHPLSLAPTCSAQAWRSTSLSCEGGTTSTAAAAAAATQRLPLVLATASCCCCCCCRRRRRWGRWQA